MNCYGYKYVCSYLCLICIRLAIVSCCLLTSTYTIIFCWALESFPFYGQPSVSLRNWITISQCFFFKLNLLIWGYSLNEIEEKNKKHNLGYFVADLVWRKLCQPGWWHLLHLSCWMTKSCWVTTTCGETTWFASLIDCLASSMYFTKAKMRPIWMATAPGYVFSINISEGGSDLSQQVWFDKKHCETVIQCLSTSTDYISLTWLRRFYMVRLAYHLCLMEAALALAL